MGPIAYLADLTRMWCKGNTWNFEFYNVGSTPIVLEIRGFNPYNLSYQDNSFVRHISYN